MTVLILATALAAGVQPAVPQVPDSVTAAGHGIAHTDAVRGHGLGVVVQGLGLLVLDGVAYAGSRGRMEALQGIADRVSAGPSPGSLDVTLLSLGVW